MYYCQHWPQRHVFGFITYFQLSAKTTSIAGTDFHSYLYI